MVRTESMRELTTVDLFAGAGGLSLGFELAGFRPLLATDFDPAAATSFRANFPGAAFIERPIAEISSAEFLREAGLAEGELDCLLGGPPCQAFSVYNHQRGFHDERSGLFREYLRVVEAFLPKTVVMENVPGMTSLGGGQAVDEIHDRLADLGYDVEHRILEAERYGVPQERRRIFFIGSRVGDILWPEPTHGDPTDLLQQHLPPFVTVEEAIGDLPPLDNGGGTEDQQAYPVEPFSEYQKTMREGSSGVWNHMAPNLAGINLERMKFIPQGGSWRDIPHHLLPAGMKRARRSDHTKRYGRLDPNGLSSTILTKCDLHWGAYIHPHQDRTLTVREAARFQSFPDRFRFFGSRVEQYRQVGNAVPPLLAKAVAAVVREMIVRSESMANKEALAANAV